MNFFVCNEVSMSTKLLRAYFALEWPFSCLKMNMSNLYHEVLSRFILSLHESLHVSRDYVSEQSDVGNNHIEKVFLQSK